VNPTARLFLAAACLAAWLVLLLVGYAFGGATHLLGILGVVLAFRRAGRLERPEEVQ